MKVENVEKQVLKVTKDCLVLTGVNKDGAVIILKDTLKDASSEVSIDFTNLDDFEFFRNKLRRAWRRYSDTLSRKIRKKSAKHND